MQYVLSNKKGTDGMSEIRLRLQPCVGGKVISSQRAKTGIRIKEQYFSKDYGVKPRSKRQLYTPDVAYHSEQAEKLRELVTYVEERFAAVGKDALPKKWLQTVIDEYYSPERETVKRTFCELAEDYISKKQLSNGYVRAFRVVVRDVVRYEGFVRATEKGRKDFIFDVDKVTREDIEDFSDYLRNESKLADEYPEVFRRLSVDYPSSMSSQRTEIEMRGNNTLHTILGKLRTFFSWMNANGITANRPFDGFKIVAEQYGTPIYITVDEREQIATAAMPTKQLQTQRDIFIFQCLVGCRVSDLMKLTEKNITNAGDVSILSYTPHKTKDDGEQAFSVRVPLLPEALQLIEKYKGKDAQGRLFPFIAAIKYNVAIKAVFTFAGITRNVEVRNSLTGEMELRPINEVASSHMARRTFVGNLYSRVQDPNLIGQMSGHVEGSRAFGRYRKIENETLAKVMELIK